MLTSVTGSLFDSSAQTLVNAVNTVGVMGKGIAAEFKARFPAMFTEYAAACRTGTLMVGTHQLHRGAEKWVLNFPTSQHWRSPSRLEWVDAGLAEFAATSAALGITSAAFPMLG